MLLLAAGSVWATSFDTGTVTRIDPASRKPTRVYRDGTRCFDRKFPAQSGTVTTKPGDARTRRAG